MASRIRGGEGRLFECFLEISKPVYDATNKSIKDPVVLNTFPLDFKDTEKLKSVPHFVFPCVMDISTVQNFSFVLTNMEAQWTFGFCRLAPGPSESALVILSTLGWHELFYKLLNFAAELLATANNVMEGRDRLKQLLTSMYDAPVPTSGIPVHVGWSKDNKFVAPTPQPGALPSIPENRNLTEYLNAVGIDNMIVIFASLLHERRIIVASRRLSRLSSSVQAANTLIYPMQWQHLFIPVLPSHLVDYLSAPMPYLIGVPMAIMQEVNLDELGDVVVLNADTNEVASPYTDLQSIPLEVTKRLKSALKAQSGLLGEAVARAFLQALVQLIGGYREALKFRQGEKITFSEADFIRSRPASLQPFLEQMLHLQIFRQFVDERLAMLNEGRGSSDEFEMEVMRCQQQLAVVNEYGNNKLKLVRKEGGALVKAVKSKANPAVKNAVKSVKESSKGLQYKGVSAYKEMKSRMKPNFSSTALDSNRLDSSRLAVHQQGSTFSSAPSSPSAIKRSDSVSSTSSSGTSYESRGITKGDKKEYDNNAGILRLGSARYDRFDSSALVDHDDLDYQCRRDNNYNFNDDDDDRLKPLDLDLMSDLQDLIFTNKNSKDDSRSNKSDKEGKDHPPPVPRHLKPSLRRTVALPLSKELLNQLDVYENDPFSTNHVQSITSSDSSEPTRVPNRPARRRETLIDLNTGHINKDAKPNHTGTAGDDVHRKTPTVKNNNSDAGADDLIRLESHVNNADIIFDPLLELPSASSQPSKVAFQLGQVPVHTTPEMRQPSSKASATTTPSPDALLREYGIDFSNLAVTNRTTQEETSFLDLSDLDPLNNNSGNTNVSSNFKSRASWTTFD